jgi:hypothetical protein
VEPLSGEEDEGYEVPEEAEDHGERRPDDSLPPQRDDVLDEALWCCRCGGSFCTEDICKKKYQ